MVIWKDVWDYFNIFYLLISLINNSQKLERTQISLNRRMDTENVIHLQNGILCSFKDNKFDFVSQVPQRPVCAGEPSDCRSSIASGTGPFFRPSSSARKQMLAPDISAPSMSKERWPEESTQERVGLPRVLTEANRITRGTSYSQRRL